MIRIDPTTLIGMEPNLTFRDGWWVCASENTRAGGRSMDLAREKWRIAEAHRLTGIARAERLKFGMPA